MASPSSVQTVPIKNTFDVTNVSLNQFLQQHLSSDWNGLAQDLGIEDDVKKYSKSYDSIRVSDLIALARNRGISTKTIVDTINAYAPDDKTVYITSKQLRDLNHAETPAIYQTIVDKINNENPSANAYAYKTLSPGGETRYTIRYTNVNNENVPYYIYKDDAVKENMTDAELNAWYDNSLLKHDAVTQAITKANAQRQNVLGSTVLEALKGNVGTNVNAFNSLSAEDRASITAALPSTDNLHAYNQTKDANIFSTLITNLQKSNPELLERMSLDELKGLADTISGEQQSITERGITNQQAQLLQNIAKDPELYNTLVQQQRANSAANTIAGQRAADAGTAVAEADANYDKQASELYANLFGGEKNVAQSTYETAMGGKVSALDQVIQGKIDDAMESGRQDAVALQELSTLLTSLEAALDVDLSKYKNEVAEAQTAASGNADKLSTNLQSNLKTQVADADADLKKVKDLFGEASSVLTQGDNTKSDVSAAVQVLLDAMGSSVAGGGYKVESAGEYQKQTDLLDNKAYDELVNSPEGRELLNFILSDKAIQQFTEAKSLDDYMTAAKLDDITKEGLTSYYTQFNDEATQQANKVFNQAQRAYIAAITAGDAKTAEQLIRLANTASTSKGNLYAASALANQFKQQSGLANNGRQLATDFLNQQSYNRQNVAQSVSNAGTALNKYLGNGADGYDKSTIYSAFNQHKQNAATGFDAYGKFGNKLMTSTQGLNDQRVANQINNYDRLSQLANEYTLVNATAGANNKTNQGTKDTLAAAAGSLKTQGQTTLDKLNKK